jgi:aryl-alcohol dehydrogenase-like predicted oxidoreductase
MHRPDYLTDIDETLSALSDVVRAGKACAIGISTFAPEQIVEAQWCAERRGHIRPRTEQPPYSLLMRGAEATTLPLAQRFDMGVLTWSPLNSGWLSGQDVSQIQSYDPSSFDLSIPANAAKLNVVTALKELASQSGLSLPHLAVAFVRAHPAVTSVIVGPVNMEQLEDHLAGVETTLGDDILDRIDEIVPPGVDLNPADGWYTPHPAVTDKTLRRRSSIS